MEQNKLWNKIKENKNIAMIFASAMLLLNSLWGVNRGVDLMDAGYGLGNFTNINTMDINWKLATFLANVFGASLTKLPGGNTLLGMNIYTSLLVGIVAIIVFLFLVKMLEHPVLIFTGEWIALSLCWAPTTVLYHYLSYLLMTGAVMLLVYALHKEQWKGLLVAGILLGANILVRFPNITHMACILIVWYDAFLQKKKIAKVAQETGICIVGYVIGLGIPFGIIMIKYGFNQYVQMIQWLFGMTETATDYKPTSMVTAMFGDYIQYAVWLALMIFYLAAGLVLFQICKGKWELAKKVIYVLGALGMLRFFYGRGMFDFHYEAYFSMYKWLVVFLLAFWMVGIWFLLQSSESLRSIEMSDERQHVAKMLTVGMMVMVLITPLGSNNGLYPIINNLFLPAPMTIYLLYVFAKKYQYFAVKVVIMTLILCVLIQSTMFGGIFAFHDAGVATDHVKVTNIPVLQGMTTTTDKAAALESTYDYLVTNQLSDREVILYGDIPALSYFYEMRPAVFTTWSDLASNSGSRLQQELKELSASIQADPSRRPVIILSAQAGAFLTDDAEAGRILEEDVDTYTNDTKLQAIAGFIAENGYTNTYCNQTFTIFE